MTRPVESSGDCHPNTPFPERGAYTFVSGGRMTLVGQRGSRAAEVITGLGALNQLQDDILDLVLGKGVR